MKLRTPDEIFQNGVSPSMVKLWLLCKRRWYNHYVRDLALPPGVDAQFGSAIHAFLQSYYGYEAQPTNEQEATLKQTFQSAFPETLNTDKRTQELGLRLVETYISKYPRASERFKVLKLYEKDTHLQIDTGMGFKLNMIVDMLVEQLGGVWVLDHKTTGSLGATYFEQFRNDYQVWAYLWGMGRNLGKPVEGMIIDAIGCKQKVDATSFMRKDFVFTQSQIDYHFDSFCRIVDNMISQVNKTLDVNDYPMNAGSTACRAYNVNCPYLQSCEFNDNQKFLEEFIQLEDKTK